MIVLYSAVIWGCVKFPQFPLNVKNTHYVMKVAGFAFWQNCALRNLEPVIIHVPAVYEPEGTTILGIRPSVELPLMNHFPGT